MRDARSACFIGRTSKAEPAELHPAYAALLALPGVRAILPGSRVRLASRHPTMFGWGHADVDQPPEFVG